MQAILAIQPPTEVKQLQHFLGMVQYYRDLWARQRKMLFPLTSLVGECGQCYYPHIQQGYLGYPSTYLISYNLTGKSLIQ